MDVMSIKHIRQSIQARHEAVAARKDMERLLSVYSTPADIDDILAAVDREDGPQAELMREVLTDNLAAYHRRTFQASAAGIRVAA